MFNNVNQTSIVVQILRVSISSTSQVFSIVRQSPWSILLYNKIETIVSSAQCPRSLSSFFHFASMTELLIYFPFDEEIIFPSNLYTFCNFWCEINLIRFSQHSIVCTRLLDHRHNNRDRNVGMKCLPYIYSILFLIRTKQSKRPFVFYFRSCESS